MIQPKWPPLKCSRCGGDVWVEMTTEGTAFLSLDVVDCISCSKCGAQWDQGGDPIPTEWLAELEGEGDGEKEE